MKLLTLDFKYTVVPPLLQSKSGLTRGVVSCEGQQKYLCIWKAVLYSGTTVIIEGKLCYINFCIMGRILLGLKS